MTPAELSDEVAKIVADAQSRVGPDSIGAQQYHTEGKPQKFETMSIADLAVYLEEEALDLVNYGVMMVIRARRLFDAADEVDSRGIDLDEVIDKLQGMANKLNAREVD